MPDDYSIPTDPKTADDWHAIGAMRVRARTDPAARRAITDFDSSQTAKRNTARAERDADRDQRGDVDRGRRTYKDRHSPKEEQR